MSIENTPICETNQGVVPLTGLEPVRSCPQRILSPRCLPFHHNGVDYRIILAQFFGAVKGRLGEEIYDHGNICLKYYLIISLL